MNEEKFTSGRGGKREGAGRPKGTTKEKVKKKFSFRLSEEEEKAVRELLAKMRGKLILLFCLIMLGLPTLAEPIKGSVTYTEENARIEAFNGVKTLSIDYSVGWDNPKYYFDLKAQNDVLYIQEYKAKFMKLIPFKWLGVVYKDEPNKAYTYEKINNSYKLVTTETVEQLPNGLIRSLTYSQNGHLMSVSLMVDIDREEEFVFDKNKKTIGHWIGNNGKEITTNTNITRKIIYSAQ